MTEQELPSNDLGSRGRVSRIWRATGKTFAFLRISIANVLVVLVLIFILALFFVPDDEIEVKEGSILVFQPASALVEEYASQDVLDLLTSGSPFGETRLRDVLKALRKATDDPRVVALEIRPERLLSADLVQLETIGDAINAFKESGKPVVAYSRSYSQTQYLLASHADQIYMHPLGSVLFGGFAFRSNFYARLFEKLKINFHTFKAGEYKTAIEPYTESEFSPAARTAYQPVVDALWQSYTERVAGNRGLPSEFMDEFLPTFPDVVQTSKTSIAEVLRKAGFVDELLVESAMTGSVRERITNTTKPPVVAMSQYLSTMTERPLSRQDNKVAVVTVAGVIRSGSSNVAPQFSYGSLKRLRNARTDDKVRALVVRVDSPGGTVIGSEQIRHEIELAKQQGMPTVVSMAGTAASGGYWLAAAADYIFASESTLTGSIGVFSVIPTFEDSLETIGVDSDEVTSTDASLRLDPVTGLGEGEQKIMQAMVDTSYARFLEVVSNGRKLDSSLVASLAEGRIWTGGQARKLGLVDALGDLDAAITRAAELAFLEEYEVKEFRPERNRLTELLMQPLSEMQLAHELKQWLTEFNQARSTLELPTGVGDVYAYCRFCSSYMGL